MNGPWTRWLMGTGDTPCSQLASMAPVGSPALLHSETPVAGGACGGPRSGHSEESHILCVCLPRSQTPASPPPRLPGPAVVLPRLVTLHLSTPPRSDASGRAGVFRGFLVMRSLCINIIADVGCERLLRSNDSKNHVNGATLRWSQSCHPRGPALQVLCLQPWNVQTGQNNLWMGPKATQ